MAATGIQLGEIQITSGIQPLVLSLAFWAAMKNTLQN